MAKDLVMANLGTRAAAGHPVPLSVHHHYTVTSLITGIDHIYTSST